MAQQNHAPVIISANAVTRTFTNGRDRTSRLVVLRGVTLSVQEGEIIAIVGASGAGKSTLLHIIGTLDRPTSGTVLYEGTDVFSMGDVDLARFRNEKIATVARAGRISGIMMCRKMPSSVAPSMRLKWLRDGVEDYEYIELLKQAGAGPWALQVAADVGGSWNRWTRDPQHLETARSRLGEALSGTVRRKYGNAHRTSTRTRQGRRSCCQSSVSRSSVMPS